jgi:[protein-PII] uridylyltransferase
MGDQQHLDYLYTLTVADINATNPTLWNSWRASLMRQLYVETKRALRRGLEHHVDKKEWIEDTQNSALSKLEANGFNREEAIKIWDNPGDDYFLRETANDIAWHTQSIADHRIQDRSGKALVAIKTTVERQLEGATQIFIYTPNRPQLFALIATCLEHLDLSIVDARIITSSSGYSMDTFFVLDANGESIGNNSHRILEIQHALQDQLDDEQDYYDIVKRRTPRRLKNFAIPTSTRISTDINKGQTILEVISPDRPGLLARVGQIFVDHHVQLQNAKIATLGERVEDVFFLTDVDQQPITDPERCDAIVKAIRETLDENATD